VLLAIIKWIERTRAELVCEEGPKVPQAVADRRRAMVEACRALARAAVSVLSRGDTQSQTEAEAETETEAEAEPVLLAAEALLQLATDGGGSGGSKAVAHSAAAALLQLCSCPARGRHSSSSMYGGKMGWPVGWQGNDAAVVTAAETVGEGLRRLRQLSRAEMADASQARPRRQLLMWLETQCAARGDSWRGLGKWAYTECHEKSEEVGHATLTAGDRP
jgi:hypothetical protein